MPEPVLRVAAAILATTFAWAALAKIVRWTAWRDALSAYELPSIARAVAQPAVPALEALVAVLVFVGATHPGAAVTILLLSSFSGALLHAHARHGDRLPCGCFGRATTRDYRLMLTRNAALGALAAMLLVARGDVSAFEGLAAPSGAEVLPAALVVAGAALSVWTVWRALTSLGRRG